MLRQNFCFQYLYHPTMCQYCQSKGRVFTESIIELLPILKGHNSVMHGRIWLVYKRNRALMYIQILYKFGKHWIINDDFILFTRSIIAILPILKGHNPVMVFERNQALMYIQLLNKFGKHQIINEDFNLFTRSFIAILPILKGHNPIMHNPVLVFERNRALMYISSY